MIDRYVVVEEAASAPVTLAEAKAFCRIEVSDDDTIIDALISAATEQGELFTNRVFVERTIEGFFSGVCSSHAEPYYFIEIRRSPLITLSALEVYSGGAYAAFTDYVLRNDDRFSRVLFPNGLADANLDSDAVYPFKITFTCGYGAAADVPDDIKQAVLAHINFLYENRGDVIADGKISMPLEAKAIYSGKYRIMNTF